MNIEAQKFYQVQKYVSMTGHTIDMGTIVIGDKYFRSLPDDLRAALIEAEGVAQLAFSSTAALFDSIGVARLTRQGMQFNYLTPEQIKVFRDRCIPLVREYLDEELGKEFVDRFMKTVDDAKQSIIDESKVK
jgi:C4-dicarboxylate-binding protein DctP